ncbi:hypothetical protein MT325_m452R [Paramecium bursaria chlorella virus MT325]|uniref:Uncharacterized protein m452R n=1 Tax=Paramecium bursaria Chlorella virus MT325 TaxID=346932 RepID=A7IUI2_PBCVM|nr:hypothetical protein MT325_m452R [Paramecium bursaria chlorella virus MT325]
MICFFMSVGMSASRIVWTSVRSFSGRKSSAQLASFSERLRMWPKDFERYEHGISKHQYFSGMDVYFKHVAIKISRASLKDPYPPMSSLA